MWNLMAVEDESIVRVWLRYMMNWESFRMLESRSIQRRRSLAHSGEGRHPYRYDRYPDAWNGRARAGQTDQTAKPRVQIIFLSSYDNFSYAKEAIRIGAVNYLHKPTMDEEEVACALRKVIAILEQTQETQQQLTEEQKNDYLLSLLDSYTFPESPLLRELESDTFKAGYRLIVFRKRDDAIQDDDDAGHLRFLSIQYLVDEYVSKDWRDRLPPAFPRNHLARPVGGQNRGRPGGYWEIFGQLAAESAGAAECCAHLFD